MNHQRIKRMSKDKELKPEDRELFREHVGDVRRHRHDRIELKTARPLPIPIQTRADECRVLVDMLSDEYMPLDLETGEEISFIRPGLQHRLARKLRRGEYKINAELDLHGLNVEASRQALATFLVNCQAENRRCVRIIHGKGLSSRSKGPVLKQMVNRWLRQRKEVLAFCSTIPKHGGTGAVYVLLRKP